MRAFLLAAAAALGLVGQAGAATVTDAGGLYRFTPTGSGHQSFDFNVFRSSSFGMLAAYYAVPAHLTFTNVVISINGTPVLSSGDVRWWNETTIIRTTGPMVMNVSFDDLGPGKNLQIVLYGSYTGQIPVPASAALLPLGIGALAIARRRRKAA